VLAFVALSLVGVIGFGGLAIDLGRSYVVKARLGRAVDAAALAGASAVRLGETTARQHGTAVAALNGIRDGVDGVSFSLHFDTNAEGEQTVSANANRPVPVTLMRILGWEKLDVAAAAVAAVPPVDLVLVLDQSGSLATQNAWDDLQSAAKSFVDYFNDVIDQVGLVHFQVRADHSVMIDQYFKTSIASAIGNMNSVGDTNTGEGLRLALEQEKSVKVMVFFTDGRPTAFRGMIGGEDRMIAVSTVIRGTVRGYMDDPDNLSMDRLASPDGCVRAADCYGWSESEVREEGRQKGIAMADAIRDQGVLIYTIGLGNPKASDPILQPDLDYLELLANVDGVADDSQPRGRSYFAPSASELQGVFDQVARDLLVRLTQ
jgi:Flp pilus assembly protein TadG